MNDRSCPWNLSLFATLFQWRCTCKSELQIRKDAEMCAKYGKHCTNSAEAHLELWQQQLRRRTARPRERDHTTGTNKLFIVRGTRKRMKRKRTKKQQKGSRVNVTVVVCSLCDLLITSIKIELLTSPRSVLSAVCVSSTSTAIR